jgi:rRNA maturation endonuclease Nob1
MVYSFDTNVFIELERNYTREENQKMWEILESKLSNREILVSEEVIEELQIKDPKSIGKWLKDNYKNCIVETSIEIQEHVRRLVNKYKGWIDPHSTLNKADPYVIAVAIQNDIPVVTEEKINKYLVAHPNQISEQSHALKIPNICILEGLKCYNMIKYLIEIGSF